MILTKKMLKVRLHSLVNKETVAREQNKPITHSTKLNLVTIINIIDENCK